MLEYLQRNKIRTTSGLTTKMDARARLKEQPEDPPEAVGSAGEDGGGAAEAVVTMEVALRVFGPPNGSRLVAGDQLYRSGCSGGSGRWGGRRTDDVHAKPCLPGCSRQGPG